MARKANWKFRNMAHTQFLDHVPQNFHSAPFVELRQSLPSQVDVISQFVDQLMRFILHFRPADGSEIDIEAALHEALANAVVHGNGENPCKLVYVECRCYTDGEVSITIRDEGRGFDASTVPDPTTAESRLLEHGRGIYLMKTLMDEVWFEDNGAVVRMRKQSNVGSARQRRAA
jgi:serine/threonine-protein kinase RsbW